MAKTLPLVHHMVRAYGKKLTSKLSKKYIGFQVLLKIIYIGRRF